MSIGDHKGASHLLKQSVRRMVAVGMIIGMLSWSGGAIAAPQTSPVQASESSGKNAGVTLRLKITGLRNARGVLRVRLYDDRQDGKGFPGEEKYAVASQVIEVPKESSASASDPDRYEVHIAFPGLTPGRIYAVAAHHDENNNRKMDTHWYGKPKEGGAASNNPRPAMRAPRFGEAKFTLPAEGVQLTLSMIYP